MAVRRIIQLLALYAMFVALDRASATSCAHPFNGDDDDDDGLGASPSVDPLIFNVTPFHRIFFLAKVSRAMLGHIARSKGLRPARGVRSLLLIMEEYNFEL